MFKLKLRGSRKRFIKENMRIIKKLYNGVKEVYGPYNNSKDGRFRVVLYDGKRRITRQFSKLKMEVLLNRRLDIDETVDHKDEDFTNDATFNLQVLERTKHIKLDVVRVKLADSVECVWCGNKFKPTRHNADRVNRAGPFCSKFCTGHYGANIQNGGKILNRNKIPKKYYKNKHL